MTQFMIYDIKVAVLIAVFYLFYRLLLAKESFHAMNRVVLLLTALMSFVLPLCVITIHVASQTTPMGRVLVEELTPIAVEAETFDFASIIGWLFVAVMILRLIYVAISWWKLQRFIASCEQHSRDDGVTIAVTDRVDLSPFSWMHTIVLPRSDYEHGSQSIIVHELGHIRRRHSWDVLLMEIICSVQWFNPAVWMIRQDLRAIHEFEADADVIEKGFNAHEYLDMLVTKAAGQGAYSMANGISNSTLKKRIQMMMKQKSFRWRRAKVLYVIPVIALSLACTSKTEMENPEGSVKTDDVSLIAFGPDGNDGALFIMNGMEVGKDDVLALDPKYIESLTVLKDTVATKIYGEKGKNGVVLITTRPNPEATELVVKAVDAEMPEFPGGTDKVGMWISQHVKYPAEAIAKGISGSVNVNFVVDTDGSIVNVKVADSVHELLDAEAVRLVSSMPKWKPGKKDGKPVRVWYQIPVNFKLQ